MVSPLAHTVENLQPEYTQSGLKEETVSWPAGYKQYYTTLKYVVNILAVKYTINRSVVQQFTVFSSSFFISKMVSPFRSQTFSMAVKKNA